MKVFRRVWRITAASLNTLFFYGLFLAGKPFAGKKSQLSWRHWILNSWAATSAVILRVRIDVDGTPPEPPFFLVCNHLSYLDVIPLYKHLNCTFVAMKEVGSWPVIGRITRSIGVLFIDRNKMMDVKRVNALLTELTNSHQGVVIFPEGGTSDGSSVKPFKSALLALPSKVGRPVHYASISYTTGKNDPTARESVCWWGGVSFGEHILRLTANRSISCKLTFGREPVHKKDRKELGNELEKRVRKLHGQTTQNG